MRSALLALLPLTALQPWASAGGWTGIPSFRGTAHPVIPPTGCHSTLNPPKHLGTLYIYGSQLKLASPLQISSCWIGRLNGQPFTLLGYANTTNDSAVLVKYGQHSTLISLGNGTPTVTSFASDAVCYIPNLAKGVAYLISITTGRVLDSAANVCRPDLAITAIFVSGLKAKYKINYGVMNIANP